MENETIEIADEVAEPILCDGCVSVPLSVLALETEEPINGWGPLFDELGIKIITDYIGRKAIVALSARRLLSEVARRERFAVEAAQARSARLAAKHPVTPGGVPMVEGASPHESMAASPGYQLPSDEFQGIPRPRFLEEALAEGDRDIAEKTAAAKERLTERMRDKLGGKQ